ncbi:hypothetical protein [Neobacillus niacini]|uniref:hypothetical protein n=1 Tax=Neobacillus niacini TaxID=86668 RepID=UPI0028650A4A|nr:hypothetical protein [Neobacillus niacini]MDR6999665.1 hypothetical protein [Neobacillus niacini]
MAFPKPQSPLKISKTALTKPSAAPINRLPIVLYHVEEPFFADLLGLDSRNIKAFNDPLAVNPDLFITEDK